MSINYIFSKSKPYPPFMIHEESYKVYHKQSAYQHSSTNFLLELRHVCVKYNKFHLKIVICIDL
jgi:hypothetical protein